MYESVKADETKVKATKSKSTARKWLKLALESERAESQFRQFADVLNPVYLFSSKPREKNVAF
jgi:hypothetical protein